MPEGQAVVLDNPKDPLGILLSGQRAQQMNLFRNQQLGLQQRKANDADMNKVLGFKYEDPGDRFRAWGQDAINQANQGVMDIYHNNPGADPTQLRSAIMNVQGAAQKHLNYSKEINGIYDEKLKALQQMPNVDPGAATAIMNQAINKQSPYEVDRHTLENIEQVPAIYDLNSLVASGVKDLKDQVKSTNIGQLESTPLGQFMKIEDNKIRFKDIDKTIDYILRGDDVTDAGIGQKINGGLISDRVRYSIAQKEVAAAGGNPSDVHQVMEHFKQIQYDPKYAPQVRKELHGLLDQLNQEERDVKIQTMGKFKQPSFKDESLQNSLMLRDKNLKTILKPFGNDDKSDTPTPEAQSALARVIGGDFGGGKVTDATYQKGGYSISPEYIKTIIDNLWKPDMPKVLREAKNHLIVSPGHKMMLTVKTGTLFGQPETSEPIPIPLDNPNAEVIVNALMNKNEGEKKLTMDDVTLYRNKQKAGKPIYADDNSDGYDFEN